MLTCLHTCFFLHPNPGFWDDINPNLDGGTEAILFRPLGWQLNHGIAIEPHLPCGMMHKANELPLAKRESSRRQKPIQFTVNDCANRSLSFSPELLCSFRCFIVAPIKLLMNWIELYHYTYSLSCFSTSFRVK